MEKQFKILLISISWSSPNKIQEITKSFHELKPSNSNGNRFEFDLVLYTKEADKYFQFCIQTSSIPFLKSTDNDGLHNNQLFNIQDDLWIIKGDWDFNYQGKGYHKCPTINTVGKIEIGLASENNNIDTFIEIDVNPNIDDFNFDALKDDFEGELWNLLTSNKSKLQTKASEVKLGDKIFRLPESHLMISFIKVFEIISKNPKRELKYAIELLPIDKVKPISKTYQQIAKSGLAKKLPSKTHKEHYDIYENRFLCLMLYNISKIVNNNERFTSQQIVRLQNEIKDKNRQIDDLENPPKLNLKILQQAIIQQRDEYRKLKTLWNKISNELKIGADGIQKNITLNIKYADNNKNNYYWGFVDKTYSYFKIPDRLVEYLEQEEDMKYDVSYMLNCNIVKSRQDYVTKSDKVLPFYFINSITEIHAREVQSALDIFRRQSENYITLENNKFNQFSILTNQEKTKAENERNNQIETLKKHIKKLQKQIDKLERLHIEFTELIPYIFSHFNSQFVKSIDFKRITAFKPSMTFIQNVNYRKAYNYYQQILQSEGIDIKIFGLYEQITNYGIREIPQVYELWTLISVIKVLEQSFNFQHNANDLKNLLEIISPDSKKIDNHAKIEFNGNLNGRTVILHYQKRLSNNKRPDILLEVSTNDRTVNLILDAKYKNYNYKLSATYEARDMLNKYGDPNNNYVFTLHPCNDLDKGEYVTKLTNFGGEKVYVEDNQIVFPFHKFGYLMNKPLKTDNLKKIIGMSFEYLMESEHNAQKDKSKDPNPEYDMICLSCGEGNITKNRISRGNNRYHYSCECQNSDCHHKIYIDYCWNCKTILYKHGSYWDYHRTSIWSIFDIHCPNCGMTVADMPQN